MQKKYVVGAVIFTTLIVGHLAYNRILLRGCELAAYRAVILNHGEPTEEQQAEIDKGVARACQQLLN